MKNTYMTQGAAYIFERDPKGVMWSRHSKLMARDSVLGSQFGARVSTFHEHTIISSNNDFEAGAKSG